MCDKTHSSCETWVLRDTKVMTNIRHDLVMCAVTHWYTHTPTPTHTHTHTHCTHCESLWWSLYKWVIMSQSCETCFMADITQSRLMWDMTESCVTWLISNMNQYDRACMNESSWRSHLRHYSCETWLNRDPGVLWIPVISCKRSALHQNCYQKYSKQIGHVWMSIVTRWWVKSRINESYVSYEWVMSRMNESCHACMNESCRTFISIVDRACMNECCHRWMSHRLMSHVTYGWGMSHMNESCHVWMSVVTGWWVMSRMDEACHVWISHVTYEWVLSRMHESCHVWMSVVTYECVLSRVDESRHNLTSHGSQW